MFFKNNMQKIKKHSIFILLRISIAHLVCACLLRMQSSHVFCAYQLRMSTTHICIYCAYFLCKSSHIPSITAHSIMTNHIQSYFSLAKSNAVFSYSINPNLPYSIMTNHIQTSYIWPIITYLIPFRPIVCSLIIFDHS